MTEWALFIALLAGPKVGLSHIALCHPDWRCEASVRPFRDQDTIRLGWLGGPTFGERCRCADYVLSRQKPKIVRVHIANGPCLRNRRCGKYEIFHSRSVRWFDAKIRQRHPKLMKRFDRWARLIAAKLAQASGELECFVSPVLESDFGVRASRILLERVRALIPQCVAVDSPHRRGCVRGEVCERHGLDLELKAPCISDMDGEGGSAREIKMWMRKNASCDMLLFWRPKFNCLSPGRFVDPRERHCWRGQ